MSSLQGVVRQFTTCTPLYGGLTPLSGGISTLSTVQVDRLSLVDSLRGGGELVVRSVVRVVRNPVGDLRTLGVMTGERLKNLWVRYVGSSYQRRVRGGEGVVRVFTTDCPRYFW